MREILDGAVKFMEEDFLENDNQENDQNYNPATLARLYPDRL